MLRIAIILHIGITGTPAPAKPLPCQFKARPVPIAFVIRSLRSSYSVPNSVSFFVSASTIPPLDHKINTLIYPAYKCYGCPRPSTVTYFGCFHQHRVRNRPLKAPMTLYLSLSSRWSIWIYLVYQQSPTGITLFLIIWDILSSVCTGTCDQGRIRTNKYHTHGSHLRLFDTLSVTQIICLPLCR